MRAETEREFDNRVTALLEEWQATYNRAGVQCASPLMDRMLAEDRVARQMRQERLNLLAGCLWVHFLDRLDAEGRK